MPRALRSVAKLDGAVIVLFFWGEWTFCFSWVNWLEFRGVVCWIGVAWIWISGVLRIFKMVLMVAWFVRFCWVAEFVGECSLVELRVFHWIIYFWMERFATDRWTSYVILYYKVRFKIFKRVEIVNWLYKLKRLWFKRTSKVIPLFWPCYCWFWSSIVSFERRNSRKSSASSNSSFNARVTFLPET